MIRAKESASAAGRAVAKVSTGILDVVRRRPPPADETAPAILEFQWPSTAIINAPIPRAARGIAWTVTSMVLVLIVLAGIIPIDQVVSARGMVVSKTPIILAQPLDTAIVRSIDVHEGQLVRAGTVLARFDPTFAASDLKALQAQVASLKDEVARLQAQSEGKPYIAIPGDPASAIQASLYTHDQSEFQLKSEGYTQKIDELASSIVRDRADVTAYKGRLSGAIDIENMRKKLEAEGYGTHLNTIQATDTRLQMQSALADAQDNEQAAQRDLAAMQAERDAYIQGWSADIAQKLTDATRKLSDSTQALNKAMLHRELVELHADRDAIVQSIAKVSVGSVVQSGEALFTLVPANASLEIEANVSGNDNGFVHVGDRVSIKFDTFPFAQYGTATGHVRIVSPDSFTAQDESRNPTGAVPATSSSEPFYRARISVERNGLHGVPPGFRVTPGMPVTADIKVGRRTVLSYLLGRVLPYAQEGMREP